MWPWANHLRSDFQVYSAPTIGMAYFQNPVLVSVPSTLDTTELLWIPGHRCHSLSRLHLSQALTKQWQGRQVESDLTQSVYPANILGCPLSLMNEVPCLKVPTRVLSSPHPFGITSLPPNQSMVRVNLQKNRHLYWSTMHWTSPQAQEMLPIWTKLNIWMRTHAKYFETKSDTA